MTDRQREFARHALGLPNKKNVSYRNHFCIGKGGDGYEDWEDLVRQGLAVRRSSSICGGDYFFHLTLRGALMVHELKEHLSQEDTAMMRRLEESAIAGDPK
jgi:hypothetical protein